MHFLLKNIEQWRIDFYCFLHFEQFHINPLTVYFLLLSSSLVSAFNTKVSATSQQTYARYFFVTFHSKIWFLRISVVHEQNIYILEWNNGVHNHIFKRIFLFGNVLGCLSLSCYRYSFVVHSPLASTCHLIFCCANWRVYSYFHSSFSILKGLTS